MKTVYVADTNARDQRLVSTVKMETVLEVYTTEGQRVVLFCGQNEFMYYTHALYIVCTYLKKRKNL